MNEQPWSPEQYARFAAERERPFWDLVAMLGSTERPSVLDLGCGTGALTARLHLELSARSTLGIDRSDTMLEASAPQPGVRFERADIADLSGVLGDQQFDVVLSNAALHWLPDHEQLLESIYRHVAPGGQLAVQVPANHVHPSHLIADQVARLPEFARSLAGYQRGAPVLEPWQYAELFHTLGADNTVRLQVYGHELASSSAVVDWVKGSLLTAYQRRLEPELFAAFVDRYSAELLATIGDRQPYFYTYSRILMVAARPA